MAPVPNIVPLLNREEDWSELRAARPDIANKLSFCGSFADYLADAGRPAADSGRRAPRRDELAGIIRKRAAKALRREVGQVRLEAPVNTTDHFGVMQHPGPFQNALVDMLRLGFPEQYLSLPGGKVPINNVTEPLRIGIGGTTRDYLDYYSKSTKAHVVLWVPALRYHSREGVPAAVDGLLRASFSQDGADGFSEQATACNDGLYGKIDGGGTRLFIEKYAAVQEYFVGELRKDGPLRAAFSDAASLATLADAGGGGLLWAKDRLRQTPVFLDGTTWRAADGAETCRVGDVVRLAELLEGGQLAIGMTTMFCTLCFYCGVECLGGVSQIRYLGDMREKWASAMGAMGFSQEADDAQASRTDRLLGGFRLHEGAHGAFDFLANGWELDREAALRAARNYPPAAFFPVREYLDRIHKK